MAWTSPKTWASGYVVLASDLNTHLRDNLNVTAPAVLTTAGDILYASGANTPARLAKSTTSTQYLSLIHISEPTRQAESRMPSSA